MTATALLRLTREQLLAKYPGLIIHDDGAEIQEPDTRAYALDPDGEYEFAFDGGGRVGSVFIHRQSSLLDGLISFRATRGEIRERYGKPSATRGEQTDPILGAQGAWDRFDVADWCIHFQYVAGSDRVKMITIMTRTVAKRVDAEATE